jgi:RimJ/RimL family protein N-acetyltransferase
MKLDVFIPGETIDLCIPTREYAEKSDWYSWLNDPNINKYLDHGSFPNTSESQVEFYDLQKKKRLLLIISNKEQNIGVISFSNVDYLKRSASVALVVNVKKDANYSPVMALESMARITEHGFITMGLDRITAGQHENLSGWQQRMELLGYRVEGVLRKAVLKGRSVADGILIAANYQDYLKLIDYRGKYWDSADNMMKRIKELPKEKFVNKIKEFMMQEGNSYYESLFKL